MRTNRAHAAIMALDVPQADQLYCFIALFLAAWTYSFDIARISYSVISLFLSLSCIGEDCALNAAISEAITTTLPVGDKKGRKLLIQKIVESTLVFRVFSASYAEGMLPPPSQPTAALATMKSSCTFLAVKQSAIFFTAFGSLTSSWWKVT